MRYPAFIFVNFPEGDQFMLNDLDKVLYINQILITVQGEGKFLGTPCLLMRFSFCNLCCPWCDTKYSWKESDVKMVVTKENFAVYKENLKTLLKEKKIKHLMITGGEPLLYVSNPLFYKLINEINDWDNVEIETNGTLLNKKALYSLYSLYTIKSKLSLNISPKLDAECYKDKKVHAFDIEMLDRFQKQFDVSYKFVHDIGSEKKILNFIRNYNIERQNASTMALTPDIDKFTDLKLFFEDFDERNQETLQFCINNVIRFSPRLHYSLFGKNKQEFKSIDI